MSKVEKLRTRKEKLERLNRKLKRKKFTAILFALFTLGLNAFAWFVFSTQVGFEVHGNIVSWDIQLRDEENELVNDVVLNVEMVPGMTDFSKTYRVNNLGDVDAIFTYDISFIRILGRDIDISSINDPYDYLENYYPFSITVSSEDDEISSMDSSDFTVLVHWDYEDSTEYHALNEAYDYDAGFQYYTHDNSGYHPATITSSTYLANRSSLFLERDDADTYFGMMCKDYENTNNEACLQIGITLKVVQEND